MRDDQRLGQVQDLDLDYIVDTDGLLARTSLYLPDGIPKTARPTALAIRTAFLNRLRQRIAGPCT